MRNCKLDSCGRAFEPPSTAEHKVFCSDLCRKTWHWLRRKKGLRALQELDRLQGEGGEVKL